MCVHHPQAQRETRGRTMCAQPHSQRGRHVGTCAHSPRSPFAQYTRFSWWTHPSSAVLGAMARREKK